MPRPNSPAHGSDSEDSAPELLTLSSTKKASRSQAEAVTAFEAAQKAKRKRENRARDAALQEAKARATEERIHAEAKVKKVKRKQRRGKEKVETKETDVANAEERMERAMREAAEEDKSGSELRFGSEDGDDDEEWTGIAAPGMGAEVEGVMPSNHLPDHLFSAVAPRPSSRPEPTTSANKSIRRKHKRSQAKEIIVGSRTLRTLPSKEVDTLTASLTLPPARINRFLKRTLHLKREGKESRSVDSNKKGKGAPQTWERRPVNVGTLRNADGPAPRFVRGT